MYMNARSPELHVYMYCTWNNHTQPAINVHVYIQVNGLIVHKELTSLHVYLWHFIIDEINTSLLTITMTYMYFEALALKHLYYSRI